MKARVLVLAVLSSSACDHAPAFKSTCTAGTPSAEALLPAQRNGDGSVILPDGRRISPAGALSTIGGFPLAMRVLPQDGGRYVVVTDGAYGDEALRVVDTQPAAGANPVVSSIAYPKKSDSAADKALFYGLALTADGKRIYVSDGGYDPGSAAGGSKHYNLVEVFDLVGSPPQLTPFEQIELPFEGVNAPSPRYPAGLALSSDDKLYVATQYDGTLAIVDVAAGATFGVELGHTMPLGIAPYD
ncbi:MAG: family beta-propeller repeat-containing protein, partial [bacterium]|nr:family beta-propeller repeat-containing protein [bacterium]